MAHISPKTPENGEKARIGTPVALERTWVGNGPPPERKTNKMEQETTNLFCRRDTFFGICEAVGQDFGFNPLYLRLAFIAPLFFFPVQTFAAYFALGGIVLASRLIFPARTAPAATEAKTETRAPRTDEMALAA